MKIMLKVIIVISLFLNSCATSYKNVGHVIEKEELDMVKKGVTSKTEVEELLGSYSFESKIGGDFWYYVSEKMSYFAFMPPKIVERNVVGIAFNSSGVVSELQTFTIADGHNIKYSKDEIISHGTSNNLVNHFMRNLGKFNRPGAKSSPINKPKGID